MAPAKKKLNPAAVERRVEDLLGQMTLKEKVALLSGQDLWHTVPNERLGIPSLAMTDGPHGVRTDDSPNRVHGPATSFPTGVSMASSWDPDLIELVGMALGEETLALGCDILLGPCVNIVRTPLAGRNFESYSEDPYLAGRIGVAWVNGVQSQNVGASLKHYAANNQEIERFRGSSEVDERTLREIYLAQFEAIVKEARPWTVMCSYNRINGVHASQNHHLLTEILKDEWGYDGVVISDWMANHTTVESIKAGLDLEMPGPAKWYGDLLVEAVRVWQVEEAVIDEAVRRILRMIVRSGRMDDPPFVRQGSVNTPQHQALARRLAEESMVLLKNEGGLLPINKRRIKSIAVIGPNADEARVGGGGSSFLQPPYSVSPLEGLRAALGDAVEIGYERGCDNYAEPPTLKPDLVTSPAGQGFAGEYFNNLDFSGEPAARRLDPQLDFWWMRLPEGITSHSYSARWTGTLSAPRTGRHVFSLTTSGVCRLFVDGALVAEAAADPKAREVWSVGGAAGFVDLVEGKKYDLRVECVKPIETDFLILNLGLAYAPEHDDRIARAAELAARSDVAVIFAGMPTGFESEGRDRPDMKLPGPQTELIRAVAAANPNTVVVLNAGAPVEMPWIEQVPAVIEAFYPGLEGGHAIANILLGKVNPSGKLSVTFPKRYEDNPSYGNYPGTRQVYYGEGVFVGYRYYDAKNVEPLFPFGHGLSYTTFSYSALRVPKRARVGQPVTVSVTVTNSGDRAGKEVVQLYVGDRESSLPRPPKELKGFQKVSLKPGESVIVTFELDERAFSFYDPYRGGWVAEPGEFDILVGSSSRDIRLKAVLRLAE